MSEPCNGNLSCHSYRAKGKRRFSEIFRSLKVTSYLTNSIQGPFRNKKGSFEQDSLNGSTKLSQPHHTTKTNKINSSKRIFPEELNLGQLQ